jgi:ribosomal protein L1
MAIQDEMYKLIEQEINQTVEAGKEIRTVNFDKAKEVARMLTSLSTDTSDADTLINQYIANIKNICNS